MTQTIACVSYVSLRKLDQCSGCSVLLRDSSCDTMPSTHKLCPMKLRRQDVMGWWFFAEEFLLIYKLKRISTIMLAVSRAVDNDFLMDFQVLVHVSHVFVYTQVTESLMCFKSNMWISRLDVESKYHSTWYPSFSFKGSLYTTKLTCFGISFSVF